MNIIFSLLNRHVFKVVVRDTKICSNRLLETVIFLCSRFCTVNYWNIRVRLVKKLLQ